jgi:hypothetical protein
LQGRALDLWDMISWRKGNYLGKGKEGKASLLETSRAATEEHIYIYTEVCKLQRERVKELYAENN